MAVSQVLDSRSSFGQKRSEEEEEEEKEEEEEEEEEPPLPVEVAAFAREHCCFVASAPNQWLFPRCACIVHHGGAGTTHAALSAGKPAVITPISFEQPDWARRIERLGVGVGFQKEFPSISIMELASAIDKAVGDDCTSAAEALGAKLRQDAGVQQAADVLGSFVENEVMTGSWEHRWMTGFVV